VTAIAACRTCGTDPLEHARFCHNCGSPVKDGDQVGHDLAQPLRPDDRGDVRATRFSKPPMSSSPWARPNGLPLMSTPATVWAFSCAWDLTPVPQHTPKRPQPAPTYIGMHEAATILNVDVRTIRNFISSGELPGFRYDRVVSKTKVRPMACRSRRSVCR
jgi:hypothetical protein